ncbi:hypothetical protein M8332_00510 [Fructilactobacillus ixorae]|uniref:Uncharacterized protein n=1 Tax=Fructilactobacillus ixorae TaxID=1750535 RepID=A0ABY5C3N9_9LACO|nr:hypothetical protein [Fructilactobacillus ixorae]USS93384.1 hypothetical protein M8332_00510 [Fructilactobacillus ixorae]
MEYSKFQYLLFRLGGLLNNKLFIAAVFLVIIAGFLLFLFYDYKTNGPILASSDVDNDQKRPGLTGKHAKKEWKNSKVTEVILALIPLVLLLLLFIFKGKLSNVDAPNQLVTSGKPVKVATGKVIWINNENGKVGITTSDLDPSNPIVAGVNARTVGPNDNLITMYEGTHISNNNLLDLHVGDSVEIKTDKFNWKYQNHDQYPDPTNMSSKKALLNKADVNGEVFKVKQKQRATEPELRTPRSAGMSVNRAE